MKKGFTLAETLITLAIIGVIAAITIPGVLAHYKERVVISKLKKLQSALSSAYSLVIAEEGTPDTWGLKITFDDTVVLTEMISKYLNVTKICTEKGDEKSCGLNTQNYFLKSEYGFDDLSKANSRVVAVALADGGSIGFETYKYTNGPDALEHVWGYLRYDINGLEGPNTYGKDMFIFYLTGEGNVLPQGIESETNHSFSEQCATFGLGCTAWIIYNENMDYLKCPEKLGWNRAKSCKASPRS